MTHTADTITNALATRAAHWIGAYDQARERLTTKLAANQVVLHELDELVTAQARVRVAHELTASIEAIADFAMGDDDALEAELRRYLTMQLFTYTQHAASSRSSAVAQADAVAFAAAWADLVSMIHYAR